MQLLPTLFWQDTLSQLGTKSLDKGVLGSMAALPGLFPAWSSFLSVFFCALATENFSRSPRKMVILSNFCYLYVAVVSVAFSLLRCLGSPGFHYFLKHEVILVKIS